MAQIIVNHTDMVTVQYIETQHEVTYTLSTPADDIGKLIGKQGRTARAFRTILGELRREDGRAYSLDINISQP